MFRNHVSANLARLGRLVNICVTIAALGLISAGYLTALGRVAGIA